MSVLITGCFDDSDSDIIHSHILMRGMYAFVDGYDDKIGNNENVMARLHSNMLIKELGGNWIQYNGLRRFLKVDLMTLNTSRYLLWKHRAVNLMKEMDVRSGDQDWIWKDTRIPITLPAWHTAVTELDPSREIEYIVCYQHPLDAVASMKKLGEDGFWGFKHIREDVLFYRVYETYFNTLLNWLDTEPDINISGIMMSSQHVIDRQPDKLFNMLRGRFNG